MKVTELDWALRLFKQSRKNRLPRGFKRVSGVIEDLSEIAFPPGEVKPYDLSKFKPFDTIMFCQSPSVRVTPESLARFMVMEGFETPSPAARAFLASIEAQTNKPE